MKRRAIAPQVERMETRNLLSTAFIKVHHPTTLQTPSAQALAVQGPGGIILGQGSANQYLSPTGIPLPGARGARPFVFKFSGAFVQTPPEFSDEASRIRVVGVGTSNFFLHGDVQLGAVVPTDPTRVSSGQSTAFDKNVNSNSAYGFDLVGTPGAVDRAGRPTHFVGATDVNVSSGTFVESQSTTTVDIHYFSDGKSSRHALSEGRATIVFRGFAYTLGTSNILNGPVHRTGDQPSKVSIA